MVCIKICGVKTPDILSVTARAGARFVGFVFLSQSPRYVHPEQARLLSRQLPTGLSSVGLFVNPTDEELNHILGIVAPDFIQLHGDETPSMVQTIKSRFQIPVIKSFGLSGPEDLERVEPYLSVIDWILYDAKAKSSSEMTGGNGVAFDWTILKGKKFDKPWMLSGGLTCENVAQALDILTPDAVDVSSGVESTRGVKDAQKIYDFIAAVRR